MDTLTKVNTPLRPNKNDKEKELDLAASDVKDLVVSAGLEVKLYEDLMKERQDKKEKTEQSSEKLTESQMRKWLVKQGKKNLICFDDKERLKLKQFFGSLDEDGSGSIGVDELVNPLISLGIAETVEEVAKIIDSVDDDKSGKIEFKEFMRIIAGTSENKGDTGIIDFFKDLISGKLAGGQISNKLPFDLIISTVRRKKLMDSMMAENQREKGEGQKVMSAYSKLLATRRKDQSYLTQEPNDSKKSNKKSKDKNIDALSDSSTSSISQLKRF